MQRDDPRGSWGRRGERTPLRVGTVSLTGEQGTEPCTLIQRDSASGFSVQGSGDASMYVLQLYLVQYVRPSANSCTCAPVLRTYSVCTVLCTVDWTNNLRPYTVVCRAADRQCTTLQQNSAMRCDLDAKQGWDLAQLCLCVWRRLIRPRGVRPRVVQACLQAPRHRSRPGCCMSI